MWLRLQVSPYYATTLFNFAYDVVYLYKKEHLNRRMFFFNENEWNDFGIVEPVLIKDMEKINKYLV